MPKYSYYCRACDEAYDVLMSAEEQQTGSCCCPNCGDEEKQELYSVSSGGEKSACSGCSGAHGCH